jgi:hypothetical protein
MGPSDAAAAAVDVVRPPNNRVEHAHFVRSTRKGDAPLLAAHAARWVK